MRRAQWGRWGKVIGDGLERQGAHRANGLGLGAIERTWALLHRGGLGAEEGHDLMWVFLFFVFFDVGFNGTPKATGWETGKNHPGSSLTVPMRAPRRPLAETHLAGH